MYKLALVLGAALAVVAVASVTDAKRTASTVAAKNAMPSIEQITSKAGDLPEQSYPPF